MISLLDLLKLGTKSFDKVLELSSFCPENYDFSVKHLMHHEN